MLEDGYFHGLGHGIGLEVPGSTVTTSPATRSSPIRPMYGRSWTSSPTPCPSPWKYPSSSTVPGSLVSWVGWPASM